MKTTLKQFQITRTSPDLTQYTLSIDIQMNTFKLVISQISKSVTQNQTKSKMKHNTTKQNKMKQNENITQI